jgi:hypothetical protein
MQEVSQYRASNYITKDKKLRVTMTGFFSGRSLILLRGHKAILRQCALALFWSQACIFICLRLGKLEVLKVWSQWAASASSGSPLEMHVFEEVKAAEPEQLALSHLLLAAKLQEQGGKEELSAAFFFERLRSCKDPWMGE